jgi:hypothetical protein
MRHSQERAFAVLGLSPGASEESVKQAFRDLAQVWHPDRFTHDQRLRAKAEEKFKEINGAYQELSRAYAGSRAPAPPAPTPKAPAPTPVSRHSVVHSSRNVRMQLPAVAITFAGRPGRLMNMSLTGGQLVLDVVPEVNSVGTLILEARGEVLRLEARVVRVGGGGGARREGAVLACAVSVKFDNIAPKDQRAIPRVCNLLLAEAAAATR